MTTIFYFMAIFPLAYEFYKLENMKEFLSFELNINKATNKHIIINLLYFFYIFIGLFTPQFMLFGLLFLLSFMPKNSIKRIFVDCVVSIMILIFILTFAICDLDLFSKFL